MRQISAEPARCGSSSAKVQVSPAVAPRKVAIIYEVDRMNARRRERLSQNARGAAGEHHAAAADDAALRAAADDPQPRAAFSFSLGRRSDRRGWLGRRGWKITARGSAGLATASDERQASDRGSRFHALRTRRALRRRARFRDRRGLEAAEGKAAARSRRTTSRSRSKPASRTASARGCSSRSSRRRGRLRCRA